MIGLDYLGLGHKLWPVASTIKLTPAGWAIGFFDDVFGDPIPAFKKLLASKKFPAYRVHMHYATNHKLIDVEQLKKRLPLYEALAKANPAIKIYVSHTCEYDESSVSAVKTRVDLIKKLAPHCIPVNCKWKGASINGVIEETHDISKKRSGKFLVSTDGISITGKMDSDLYRRRFANAEICFFWASRFNLREQYEKPEDCPAPLKRTAIPSDNYIKAIVRCACEIGTPPTPKFKGKIIPIEKPILMKAFAEDKEGDDVRANKPMLISPASAKPLDIVDMNGKRVARFAFFGHYPVGNKKYQRHYSGTGSNLWGFQIAAKAQKSSGSEFVWAKDGNTYYGPFHPQFRKGYFDE